MARRERKEVSCVYMKHPALMIGILSILLGGASLGMTFLFLTSQTSSPTPSEETEITISTPTADNGEETPQTAFTTKKLGTVDTDIPYCTIDNTELLMDFYWPAEGEGPFPIAMYVHGGGWSTGDKADNVQQYIRELTPRGIAVAAVNYRLAGDGEFPIMIEDIKCAVRHLRANAETYNIDPDKIGAFGGSAGGHLVNLLGVTDASAGWDSGPYEDVSSSVAAVVEFFGPADLRIPFEGNGEELMKNAFGQESYEDMGFASPVTYVTPNDPPFLIFHGEEDSLVPITQSELFVEALQSAGVEVTFVRVKNAGHSFRAEEGTRISPTIPEIAEQVGEWFAEHLN